jgi:hypothetical protein
MTDHSTDQVHNAVEAKGHLFGTYIVRVSL